MLTNPYDLPIALIPIPLALLGLGGFQLTTASLHAAHIPPHRSKLIGGIVVAVVLLIVLLQSIGQLHMRDFSILLVLLAGLTFYLRRLKK